MNSRSVDRRSFLQASIAATAGAGILGVAPTILSAGDETKGAPNADKLGWRLGCQAWTFNDFTFYEAIDKVASLGLHYIEAFPGQKLSADKPSLKMGDGLLPGDRNEVKKRLADNGVKLLSIGVGDYSKRVFDFAKEMGIETIVSEPPFNAFDRIEKLCEEFQINLAIHDHSKPTRYWNPDAVLAVCKDRSKRIGACCDTGHWMTSDIKPLDALKKLEGRIIELHFKEHPKYGPGRDAHDVPWGTGAGNVKSWMEEIKRQGIKPAFFVEYEHNFGKSMPEIAQCVQFFNRTAGELAST
jgi:sugar phosphate isomerase/epimerase